MPDIFAPSSMPINPILAPPVQPGFESLPIPPTSPDVTSEEAAAMVALPSVVDEPNSNLLMFEDMFPKLKMDEEEKEEICHWFDKDLRSCVKNVNNFRSLWAKYRAVYLLEYVEKLVS